MELSQNIQPKILSDLDGTAILNGIKLNPKHWFNQPRNMIDGYDSFLRGIVQSGGDISGIVSRRPNIGRFMARRSISRHGLHGYFGEPEKIVLAGSSIKKAAHILYTADEGPVGFIDNKPHIVGQRMIQLLVAGSRNKANTVVLGAVHGSKQSEYTQRLLDSATRNPDVKVLKKGETFEIIVDESRIFLARLAPYSLDEGIKFGGLIRSANPQLYGKNV